MSTFIEIFQGLPVVIFISGLFGIVALIRIYIINTPGIRRLSTQDRRKTITACSFPFQDSKSNLIVDDRRKIGSRRLASHVIFDYCVIH